ncbi:ABC transporter ATP-binding protein [Gangjinia marincola]|uniref:ABC transporter ATP-binding protein n=1 Tax=Gangjinia marincola TaxID=578463 RepID=A0ABN1MHY4_9FLAO
MNQQHPLAKITNLSITFSQNEEKTKVVHTISFEIRSNEILGVVGESGSGKSVMSLSLMGLLPETSQIDADKMLFQEKDVSRLSEKEWQRLRGNEIAMIFQEPMSSLNPSMRCGKQVTELLLNHTKLTSTEAKKEVIQLFEKVKLPRPEAIFKSYPHQLSGGQKQRVMIAMAISCKPKLLIADEPTTALDVTVQKEILSLLKEIQQETNMSILFISHDLAVVNNFADRVMVMYQGYIVEKGETKQLFNHPTHQYTKALIGARPSTTSRLKRLPTIKDFLENRISSDIISPHQREENHNLIYSKEPLLRVVNVKKEYISKTGVFQKNNIVKAVDKVSFDLYEGETLGLVGESGCGKSTLSSVILQLTPATKGEIIYKGKDLTTLSRKEMQSLRKDIQIIFQDPFSSLNPRISVGEAIMEPMKVHGLYDTKAARKEKTIELLKRVGLTEAHFYRYPHEFSGGQRQRIGIARTIALQPKIIICDESVSALDISVQAQVLNLLNELKENFGFSYLFISHDLAVVKFMANKLLVMKDGKIVEQGEADEVYTNPQKEYTKELIKAIP